MQIPTIDSNTYRSHVNKARELDTDTGAEGVGCSLTLVTRRRGDGGGSHVARGRLHPGRGGPVPARGVDGRGGGQIAAGAHRIGGGEGRGGGGEGGGERRARRRWRRRGAPVVPGVGQHRVVGGEAVAAVAMRDGESGTRGLSGEEDDGGVRVAYDGGELRSGARRVRFRVEEETGVGEWLRGPELGRSWWSGPTGLASSPGSRPLWARPYQEREWWAAPNVAVCRKNKAKSS